MYDHEDDKDREDDIAEKGEQTNDSILNSIGSGWIFKRNRERNRQRES